MMNKIIHTVLLLLGLLGSITAQVVAQETILDNGAIYRHVPNFFEVGYLDADTIVISHRYYIEGDTIPVSTGSLIAATHGELVTVYQPGDSVMYVTESYFPPRLVIYSKKTLLNFESRHKIGRFYYSKTTEIENFDGLVATVFFIWFGALMVSLYVVGLLVSIGVLIISVFLNERTKRGIFEYAYGIMVISSVVALIIFPLVLYITENAFHIDKNSWLISVTSSSTLASIGVFIYFIYRTANQNR